MLKAERVKNGLTQKDVASALSLAETSYNKKENGKAEFSISQAAKLRILLKLNAEKIEEIFFTN